MVYYLYFTHRYRLSYEFKGFIYQCVGEVLKKDKGRLKEKLKNTESILKNPERDNKLCALKYELLVMKTERKVKFLIYQVNSLKLRKKSIFCQVALNSQPAMAVSVS